jgi:hypothetical protein
MDEVGRDRFDGDLLGSDPHGSLVRIAAAAAHAARQVDEREAIVHCSYGDVPVWDYFWQLNIARCLGAHDVAAQIGAGCPLSEELCQGMWEGTALSAEMWRSFGVFRQPVPVPEAAPWRDRFLGLTGRRPGACRQAVPAVTPTAQVRWSRARSARGPSTSASAGTSVA